jgi:hypothetical protein
VFEGAVGKGRGQVPRLCSRRFDRYAAVTRVNNETASSKKTMFRVTLCDECSVILAESKSSGERNHTLHLIEGSKISHRL